MTETFVFRCTAAEKADLRAKAEVAGVTATVLLCEALGHVEARRLLIKGFPSGKGGGTAPVRYLMAPEVLAYSANRDLIRDAEGRPCRVTRDPLPEVLRGDPARTEALIDASRHTWTYRAGVISLVAEGAPSEAQQAEVMDREVVPRNRTVC